MIQPTRFAHQKGSVLLWGMVILLVMTVIGVAATRMAAVDTRIAGHQVFSMLTYQGAESTLQRSVDLFLMQQVADSATKEQTFGPYVDPVNGGEMTSESTMTMSEAVSCPPVEGIAMSMQMTPDAGGVACRIFRIDARAQLPGVAANSRHASGILRYAPPTGNAQ